MEDGSPLDELLVGHARRSAEIDGGDPDDAERAARETFEQSDQFREEVRSGERILTAEELAAMTPQQKGAWSANLSQHAKAERVWNTFVDLVARGKTVPDACKEISRSEAAYYRRRVKYPEFAARVDEVRQRMHRRRRDGIETHWDGTTAGFATRFIPPPEDAGIEWPGEDYHYSFYQHAVTNVLDGAQDGDIVLVLLPPGGRKTTTLENWAIKKLSTEPNTRILYLSKALDHAKKSVARIKSILHDDPTLAPELLAKFGPFKEYGQERKGKPWASQYFTIAGRTTGERNYSFSASGGGSQIYGSRADYIIIDDFQTNQNINATEDLLHQFQFEIITRRPTGKSSNGRRRGVIVLIGTRIDAGDFYEQIEERYAGEDWFKVVEFPVARDGVSLDEDCFPTETLAMERAQVGEVVWLTSYMQKPPTKTNATFTENDLNAARKPSMLLGWWDLDERGERIPVERTAEWGVAVGLDPNLGAGWSVATALAFTSTRIRVLDQRAEFGLAQTEDLLDMLEDFAERYRPEWVRIEIDAFQRGLARDHRLVGDPKSGQVGLTQKYGFHVREHTTTGGRKEDTTIGISRMGSVFRRQIIDIPWGDDEAIARMEPLTMELRAWRPRVSGKNLQQDRVMSTWFAWIVWLEQQGLLDQKRTSTGWKTRGMPMRGTGYEPLSGRRAG